MTHAFHLLGGVCLCSLLAYQAHAQNLLPNGSMEGTYAGGVAPKWENCRVDSRATFTLSESGAGITGKAQLLENTVKLSGFSGLAGPSLGSPINVVNNVAQGLIAGRFYEASVWVRSDRRELQEVVLAVDDSGARQGNAWQPRNYAALTGNVGTTWTRLVLRFRADLGVDVNNTPIAQSTSARFVVRLHQEGKLWVDDAVFRELTAADYDAAPIGNLIRNSSFEVGTSGWIGFNTTAATEADVGVPNGGHALRASWNGLNNSLVQSVAFSLPFRPAYTLSLWLRSQGSDAQVNVALQSAKLNGSAPLAQTTFTATSTWTRYSYTFDNLPPAPRGRAYLAINPPDGTDVLIDGVQLEAGATATAYAPLAPVEAGLTIDRANRLYFAGEAVTGQLTIYNNGSATTANLRRRATDVWGAAATAVTTWTQPLPAGRTVVACTFTPTAAATGGFRAEVDVDAALAAPHADAVFAVLSPAPLAGQNSPFGSHLQFDSTTTIPRTAGAGWTKTWYLAWAESEPSPGNWSSGQIGVQAGYLNRWRDAGIKTLAVLESVPGWARPADSDVATDLGLATAYARRMATNYGDRVAAWELCNEPDVTFRGGSAYTSPQDGYAALALAFATGVRAVLPDAPILVGSATTNRSPELWIADALLNNRVNADGKTLRELVTGVSYHNYEPDPTVTRRIVARIRAKLIEVAAATNTPSVANLEIWDTEWAPLDSPVSASRSEPDAPAASTGSSARVVAGLVAKGFITRLGEGVKNSFLYHAYGAGTLDNTFHNLAYEYDRSPRPALAAQAVAAALLTGASQPLALNPAGIWGYRFLRPDGRALFVVWADEYQTAPATYTAPVAVTATDMMGNPYAAGTYAPGATVPVGPEPVYLLGEPTGVQVSYGSTRLIAGDSGTAANGTDFGQAEANYAPAAVDRTFTLTNLNAAPVAFDPATSLAFAGTHATDFSVVTSPPASLAGGASASFTLRFLPAALGARTASLTLVSSAGTFTTGLAGTGTSALSILGLSASALNVHVTQGQPLDTSDFVLSNSGRLALTWTATLPVIYTATDSNASGGPSYNWYDLNAANAHLVAFTSANTADRDDQYSEQLPLGFAFKYYGTNYTQLRVTSNGVVNFGSVSGSAPYTNRALPDAAAPNQAIFVLWDDLYMLGNVSQAYSAQVDADTFVVSWTNVAYYGDRAARQNFQIVLRRDGTATAQYSTVSKSPNAAGFVIGLQNANSASQALLYSRTPMPPANSLAVRFNPPGLSGGASANFTPGAPSSWASFPSASSGTLATGAAAPLTLRFDPANLIAGYTYRTQLTLATNDAARPIVSIPLSLTVDALAAPSGLTATATPGGIQLSWTPVAGTGLTYQIARATTSGGPFMNFGDPITQASLLDNAPTAGATYFYTVAASAAGFTSPISPPVSATAWTALQTWRYQAFGTIIASDLADPDADGAPNLLEYALGSDPLVASDAELLSCALNAATAKLQLTFRRARGDVTYTVQGSSDLLAWTTVATNPGTVGESVTVDDSTSFTSNARRFLRLRVTAP